MTTPAHPYELFALDVGSVRIGIARASSLVRLPEPLLTLANEPNVIERIEALCMEHNVKQLVVGLPRGLQGQETAQTASIREFVAELSRQITIPIALQDEALTSKKAEEELSTRGKPYGKGDVDALAATYILEDYLRAHHDKL